MRIPGRRFMKDDKVLTDWIPRTGDNVILRGERVSSNPAGMAGITVTIRVLTKNSDETGDGIAVQQPGSSTALSFTIDFNDTGVQELVVTSVATSTLSNPKGLKQLVRLELVATGPNAEDWVEIRLFPPIFFNSAT
jgi:hypothetical protein